MAAWLFRGPFAPLELLALVEIGSLLDDEVEEVASKSLPHGGGTDPRGWDDPTPFSCFFTFSEAIKLCPVSRVLWLARALKVGRAGSGVGSGPNSSDLISSNISPMMPCPVHMVVSRHFS